MLREIDINEISDGLRYTKDSMVKIGCNECSGCSQCCHDMGNSIVLDPYDIFMLCKGLKCDFGYLMSQYIELNVVDGIIQPNIKMLSPNSIGGFNSSTPTGNEKCGFLGDDGRCRIHAFRPGFCRLFPLGRIYENDSFTYFNQIHECPYPTKTKVKVKKWLDIPNLGEYEKYILIWHNFLKDSIKKLDSLDDEGIKNLHMSILNVMYVQPYDISEDFYLQFNDRLSFLSNALIK